LGPLQAPEDWQSETDLAEYYEAVHHLCELQQYARADDLLDACFNFLDLRGYYRRIISLYSRLVQEWQPATAEEQRDLGWAWTTLCSAYFSLGQ
jgi:hypothetical protein